MWLKALCHDIRLDCFVIASLVEKFKVGKEVTWYVVQRSSARTYTKINKANAWFLADSDEKDSLFR